MNREQFAKDHPDLLAALIAEGHSAGLLAGRVEGAAAELARIQAVEAQSLPGHEALISKLKADGKTTGPEAAVQVLNAERALGASRLAAFHDDAPKPAPHAAAPAAAAKTVDASKPLEEQCKAKWDADAAIRTEFIDYASYLAYEKAEVAGRVRVLGRKAA